MVAFGTSGLRGLAEDLLAGPCSLYAQAFGDYMVSDGYATRGSTVLVGCDRRDSSPALTRQTIAALRTSGLEPIYCGVLPTPALAYHALNTGASAVMVTGSHIPADRNGLKFYRPDGEIDKTDEASIVRRAAGMSVNGFAAVPEAALPSPDGEALNAYVSRYRTAFPPAMLAGKRVGIYQHSSVASDVLIELATAYGAEVVTLGASETFVPIDTEAVDQSTARQLAEWAEAFELDTILSTDGDGDRPLMTDEAGAVIRGDALGLIASIFLKASLIVTPVSSNPGIDARFGFEVTKTRIGSPFVLEAMAGAAAAGEKTVLGFEANGGLLVGTPIDTGTQRLSPLPTRDSVLPMFCAIASAQAAGEDLSKLVADLGLPACASGRVENFPRSQSDRLMAWLRASPDHPGSFLAGVGSPHRIAEIDGLQMFLDRARTIHLRPSGNAPEMRCYTSAPTMDEASALLNEGLARIERFASEGRAIGES